MTGKENIFISVKYADDSLAQLGIKKETDDYSISREICNKLKTQSIKYYLKNTDERCDDREIQILKESRILIVIATKETHLSLAQKVIAIFENQVAPTTKKIVYLCADSIGDMRLNDFPIASNNSFFLTEAYELSQESSFLMLINNIKGYLCENYEDIENVRVQNILKNSNSISLFFENVIERKWLVDILNEWIIQSGRRNIFWLCGEHGSGKTIFVGDYCEKLENVIGKGIYYCYASSKKTQSVERIINAIAYGLCTCIKGYAKTIYDTVSDEHFLDRSADELFPELLINPFSEHSDLIPTNGNFIFIIDGIDELKTDKTDSLTIFLEILRNYAHSLPKFIRLIITSPAIDAISNTMKQLLVKTIDLAEKEYQINKKADAEKFLRYELSNLGIKYSNQDIVKLLEKAEWNFDYLHYFVEQCDEEGNGKLPLLDKLPKGLTAMFELDFSNRFSDDYYNNKVKPILQVLAAAYEPFSVIDLSQALSRDVNEIQAIIKGQLRQFLKFPAETGQREVISFYNTSFELWLLQNSHKYCINLVEGTNIILKWFEGKKEFFYENEYLQKYGLLHVLENKNYNLIVNLIRESKEDDFEKLKERLSVHFINEYTSRVNVASELLNIYRINYNQTVRIRDILVYTYRFILKRKGGNAFGLDEICILLNEKHEEIRADLLVGEKLSIYDLRLAKEHFEKTISKAINITENKSDNSWWNIRMLGVAYNRLANLENKLGNTDSAVRQYQNGKVNFDKAIKVLEADAKQLNDYANDYKSLERDEAIINERLGDLIFKKGDYEKAAQYYSVYYEACNSAFNRTSNLNSKWDLSTSLLRLGDAKRYMMQFQEAQDKYREALDLRRDILQHMRSDCISIISAGNRNYYKAFRCPKDEVVSQEVFDEMSKESRDIEPIRDIAMCYIRLGDLAFCLGVFEVAEYYYDILVKLCEKNNAEIRTKTTENDLKIGKMRKERLSQYKRG